LNVIPSEAVAGFDIRITPHTDIKDISKMINEWCSDEGINWEHVMF
jgi:aminoacylase